MNIYTYFVRGSKLSTFVTVNAYSEADAEAKAVIVFNDCMNDVAITLRHYEAGVF